MGLTSAASAAEISLSSLLGTRLFGRCGTLGCGLLGHRGLLDGGLLLGGSTSWLLRSSLLLAGISRLAARFPLEELLALLVGDALDRQRWLFLLLLLLICLIIVSRLLLGLLSSSAPSPC